jgi:hypothetical protein
MKVISIVQPWATLVMLGEKRYETRSWATKYRGQLGIHSSKKMDKRICEQEPFKSVLAKHGYTATNLPLGAILGTAIITKCLAVTGDVESIALLENGQLVEGNEYAFGDYNEGRFAWELTDIEKIEPIPAKGQLGLWNYDGLLLDTP